MTDEQAQILIASVQMLSRNVQRLTFAIGAASNKPLLNDPEFASLLGHEKPEKAKEWLKSLRNAGHAKSVRAGRLRRWERTEADKIVRVLIDTPEGASIPRKQRMRKSA